MVLSTLGGAKKRTADLYSAASNGDLKGARMALEKGADINKLNPESSETALHAAAANDDLQMVDLLLAAGATVNLLRGDGRTALMQAAEFADELVIDRLLAAGADINLIQQETGLGAFAFALNRLRMDIARHLLACGAKPVYGNIETLPLAVVEHGDLEFIKVIEARGGVVVPEDKKGRVAFVAARNLDGEVLDYVLAHGAVVNHGNDFNYTPILLAVLNNHVELVERYLARGDDPDVLDIDRETALSLAIENEHFEIVRILRAHGAQRRDYPGLTDEQAMLQAAQDGALGTILKLRDAGVSINVVDEKGNTPLMRATRAGHLGVVRSLFHLGADIDRRNQSGDSATTIANELGDQNLIATMKEFVAEDAVPEMMRHLGLGGIYDVGGMLFGRLSHPFKQNPPYGDSSEEETDDEPSLEGKLRLLQIQLENGLVAERLGEKGVEEVESLIAQLRARPDVAEGAHEKIDELIETLRQINFAHYADEAVDEDELQDGETDTQSPLFEAIESGDIQAIKRCLQGGEDPNEVDEVGNTPLSAAVSSGATEIVALLISEGAQANEELPDGNSLLEEAIENWAHEDDVEIKRHRREIIEILLRTAPSEDSSSLMQVVFLTAAGGQPDIIEIFRKQGITVDPDFSVQSDVPLLYFLVSAGDQSFELVKGMLALGANPDCRNRGGLPVVSMAIRGGALEIADALLDAGADVMARNNAGALPYDLAVIYGHIEFAQNLIVRMNTVVREVDHQDEEGRTALMRAVMNVDASAVQRLLAAGVDATRRDMRGHSPLSYAVCNDLDDIIAILRKAGLEQMEVDPKDGKLAILRAAANGAVGTVLDLLDSGVPVDTVDEDGLVVNVGNTALLAAEVHPGLIQLLVKRGADVNHRNNAGDTAYMIAAASNRELIKQTLVTLGSQVENSDEEAHDELFEASENEGDDAEAAAEAAADADLFDAVQFGDAKQVRQLIRNGADINVTKDDGVSALSFAMMKLSDKAMSRRQRRDSEQIINDLLEQRPVIRTETYSPLHVAATFKRVDLLNRILRLGVDVNQTSQGDASALLLSLLKPGDESMNVDDSCAESLLDAGCDPTLRHESGAIALHAAALSGCVSIIKRLLEMRPMDVDAVDNEGNTPLICAAQTGQADAAKLLLERGANRALCDKDGKTAMDYALEAVYPEVAALL